MYINSQLSTDQVNPLKTIFKLSLFFFNIIGEKSHKSTCIFSAANTFPVPPLLPFPRKIFALKNTHSTFISDKTRMTAGNESVGHSTGLWCCLLPALRSYHNIFLSEISNTWKILSYLTLSGKHLSATAFQLLSWCPSPPLFPICSSSALVQMPQSSDTGNQ